MAAFYDKGTYRGIITGHSIGENSKGNPECQITFKPTHQIIQGGEEIEQAVDYERRVYLVFTDATMGTEKEPGWVLQTLAYLGFNGASFADLEGHSFKERQVLLKCEHDTNPKTGKEVEKWSIIRQNNSKPVKPVEKKTLRTLDSKFGKALKAAVKTNDDRSKPPNSTPPDTATQDESLLPSSRDPNDIPF